MPDDIVIMSSGDSGSPGETAHTQREVKCSMFILKVTRVLVFVTEQGAFATLQEGDNATANSGRINYSWREN